MEKMRIVLVGCGGISSAWLDAVKTRAVEPSNPLSGSYGAADPNAIKKPDAVEIVGLVDLNREAAKKRATEYGLENAKISTNLKAVLRKTQPDVVFDCTLPESHVKVTTVALRHGCHVLSEKPLADTMPHARKMVDAAKAAGKVYAVMQNRRYFANIQALRSFLKSGAIGRIGAIHCDFFLGAHFGGFRDHMEHVLLLDMAIHTFDQARFIVQEDAMTALALEWNPPGSWYDHGASAVATFEMTNQVVLCYRGSWCAEGLNTTWEASWRIIGEKGTVLWDGAHGFQAQAVSAPTGFIREQKSLEVPYDRNAVIAQGHAGCIYDFIRCLRSGETPQTVCTDNIKSLAMVHAAIKSATKGKKVTCEIA